tara:strand:+ start:222 stop:1229 length:1008 start_codon:yes stop_codon:yes gene_type:complete
MSKVDKQIIEEQVTMIESLSTKQRRSSFMDIIKEKQKDQDFNQKMNVGFTLVLELYRVLMGAFLVAFVPQQCGDDICSLSENINRDDALSQSAIMCNVITMVSFLALYFVEVKRENKLINYLEVNRFNSVDNESVGEALEKLAVPKKQSIWDYDGYYQKTGYVSTIAFLFNAIISSIVVYNHYLDSKTLTVFLTNVLFMGSKVADVFSTVNTKKNVFYSAYLKDKVQFNDVDPDKVQFNDVEPDKVPTDKVSVEELSFKDVVEVTIESKLETTIPTDVISQVEPDKVYTDEANGEELSTDVVDDVTVESTLGGLISEVTMDSSFDNNNALGENSV